MLQLRAMLAEAKKPVSVVGRSCWTAEGRSALRKFLVVNNLPATVGSRRQADYDSSRDNFAGDLEGGSDSGRIAMIEEANLIPALSSRPGDAVTRG
jgi:acetolactate synthase-1/2/3 large subunit